MIYKTPLQLLLLSSCLFVASGISQVAAQIPASRIMNWSHAGVTGGIPTGGTEILATNYGVVADGVTDNATAINNLLNNPASLNKVIKFPAGTIRCESKIDFPVEGRRVIRGTLSGTGAKLTKFLFNTGAPGGNTGNFNVRSGAYTAREITVIGDLTKDSTQLALASTANFVPGSYIELRQDNDPELMSSYKVSWADMNASWYTRNTGQLFQVSGVDTIAKTVTLSQPLRLDYKTSLNPSIRAFTPTQRVGFENFYVESLQAGSKCNFSFQMAANCWIKNVHSFMSVTAHVNTLQSLNLTIRDSYFDHAWNHGHGGNGYGVVMASRTADSLVENNDFTRLRHSMMTKQSANGNVFGYNRSFNNINIYNSANPTVDISIHGHYSYLNLFEGNLVDWIHSADWWGPSGPGNTFFRNRITRWDVDIDDNSIDQNVVGNELTVPTKTIKEHQSVVNSFIHGNIVEGVLAWKSGEGTNNLQNSYYLSQKPAFLSVQTTWPLYGPGSWAKILH